MCEDSNAPPSESPGLVASFSPVGAAWRLHIRGNVAVYLAQELDPEGWSFPVPEPDLRDLKKFMWALDAPYAEIRSGAEITVKAQGPAVAALSGWLYEFLVSARG